MKIIPIPKTMEKTGKSRTTLWRWERKGTFPKRVRIGENSVGHIDDEVDQWIEQCIAERDAGGAQ